MPRDGSHEVSCKTDRTGVCHVVLTVRVTWVLCVSLELVGFRLPVEFIRLVRWPWGGGGNACILGPRDHASDAPSLADPEGAAGTKP